LQHQSSSVPLSRFHIDSQGEADSKNFVVIIHTEALSGD
jgi:hypothetical protein